MNQKRINRIARKIYAFEFPNKADLKKYMHEHPGADPENHWVKGDEGHEVVDETKPKTVHMKSGDVRIDPSKSEPYEDNGVRVLTKKALERTLPPNKKGNRSYNGVSTSLISAVLEFDPKKSGGLKALIVREDGKKVYQYSEEHQKRKSEAKFARVVKMANNKPKLDKAVGDDLDSDNNARRQVATVIKLIDATKMRIGTEKYAKDTGHLGATTLRAGNVSVDGDNVTFKFVGKSGVEWDRTVTDPQMAKNVAALKKGKRDDERLFGVTDRHVNAYLKQFGVTAKDFRTYHGTKMTYELLKQNPPPKECRSESKAKGCVKKIKDMVTKVIKAVSDALGNTPSVCKDKYIDPKVIEKYEAGSMKFASVQSINPYKFIFGQGYRFVTGTRSRVGRIARRVLASYPNIQKWVDEWETDDYPYGRLRTKAMWKVEGRKGKQRISRITINPKYGTRNKPKRTVYYDSAKLGVSGDRVYMIMGSSRMISIYDGSFKKIGAIHSDDREFSGYAKALGIKEEKQTTSGIRVIKEKNGATITGLTKFTLDSLFGISGLDVRKIKPNVKDVRRKVDRTGTNVYMIRWKDGSEPFVVKLKE